MKTEYKNYFKNTSFLASAVFSLALLILSLVLNHWASEYATKKASSAVTDLILSNIPAFDVANIFVYGFFIFIALVLLFSIANPKIIPFLARTTALFILIRAIFIIMTHIGVDSDAIDISVRSLQNMTSNADLFFSGHTGYPFLCALIFWKQKYLRYFFMLSSVFFGTISLLGHYHYTIDVFAAFFITYAIYHISLTFFKKEHKIFLEGI